jgi:hypothetical protein
MAGKYKNHGNTTMKIPKASPDHTEGREPIALSNPI